jgi:hypothetical protein
MVAVALVAIRLHQLARQTAQQIKAAAVAVVVQAIMKTQVQAVQAL